MIISQCRYTYVRLLRVRALYERLQAVSSAIIRMATAIGLIWAGMLIASGMVANAGIAPVVVLYGKDPAQAAVAWVAIESVSNGLSSANGEILCRAGRHVQRVVGLEHQRNVALSAFLPALNGP